MAFESLTDARIIKIKKCLEQLSRLCLEMGGRVHLTKNVMARPEDIRLMYGEVVGPFFAVKRKYDPQGILRNDFIEKLFGEAV
jgi:decaprenylphospho-beta-D-ribofuranose 2-oxidase